jgi:hypothetical protein
MSHIYGSVSRKFDRIRDCFLAVGKARISSRKLYECGEINDDRTGRKSYIFTGAVDDKVNFPELSLNLPTFEESQKPNIGSLGLRYIEGDNIFPLFKVGFRADGGLTARNVPLLSRLKDVVPTYHIGMPLLRIAGEPDSERRTDRNFEQVMYSAAQIFIRVLVDSADLKGELRIAEFEGFPGVTPALAYGQK